MAQWENARLEAEARLSRESLLFNPPHLGNTDSDYFLRIWNSEEIPPLRQVIKMKIQNARALNHTPEDAFAGSDSSSSDMQDSSDSALQLLLDFPINNDMSFLEDNYDTSSAMLMDNSLICPL
ncbi:hypothetical protein Patl1_00414 [Pistacia atlantica]|uniref:Uncharacterized protein n=1 Tax=Pistacia atlantica TaxID=434234 RepID=A0ACC1C8A6_9ROSI|nr:hypothetical protein Patl1_00414 [Pistacia atlantica]